MLASSFSSLQLNSNFFRTAGTKKSDPLAAKSDSSRNPNYGTFEAMSRLSHWFSSIDKSVAEGIPQRASALAFLSQ
jgi:hypothetical protein